LHFLSSIGLAAAAKPSDRSSWPARHMNIQRRMPGRLWPCPFRTVVNGMLVSVPSLFPCYAQTVIALFIGVGSKGYQIDGIIPAALYSPVVCITKITNSMPNSPFRSPVLLCHRIKKPSRLLTLCSDTNYKKSRFLYQGLDVYSCSAFYSVGAGCYAPISARSSDCLLFQDQSLETVTRYLTTMPAK
jgi:hypothetical protein